MMSLADTRALTQRLIRIPSISRDHDGQRRIQDACLAALPAAAGLHVVRESAGLPWTLVATDPAPAVLFACHTDTVPVGEGWEHDPFSGELIETSDGRHLIHGRGSVDMKGGLAAAVAAVAYAHKRGLSAGLLMTSDEEIGGVGAGQAAAELELAGPPALVIIPEATDNRYSRGHRGAAWFEVTARGRAAHGSTPEAGVNAISLLAEHVIARLGEMPAASDDYLGADTVNLGLISGGQAPNIVPDHAQLTLDCRTVAGSEEIAAWLGALPAEVSARRLFDLPALRTDEVPEALSGFADLGPLPYFTDGAMLAPLVGAAPIVVWGPGGGDQMHTTDEQLSVASLAEAVRNYCGVVDKLGG